MSESLSEQLRMLDSARGELLRVGQMIEEMSQELAELSLNVKTTYGLLSALGSKNWLERSLMQAQSEESLSSSGKERPILRINSSS